MVIVLIPYQSVGRYLPARYGTGRYQYRTGTILPWKYNMKSVGCDTGTVPYQYKSRFKKIFAARPDLTPPTSRLERLQNPRRPDYWWKWQHSQSVTGDDIQCIFPLFLKLKKKVFLSTYLPVPSDPKYNKLRGHVKPPKQFQYTIVNTIASLIVKW